MSLPPSAITLLSVLATRGPSTHKQLVEVAPLPERTLRFALTRLRQEGRVVERPSLRDSRQSYYLLATGDTAVEGSFLANA